jgi:broad specificity phosphatase PhoE
MKTIYFVRHGETTHNKGNLVQDGATLLTDSGTKQAFRVAERLQNLDFDNLIVSDYVRTKQTAEPITQLTNKEAVYSELFRELRRPSVFFHGPRNAPEYLQFIADLYSSLETTNNWRHSDEENFSDITNRITAALAYLSELDGDTVVVSHGNFIMQLMMTVAVGGTLDRQTWHRVQHGFRISNTGITTIFYDDTYSAWKVLTFNDHAHFAE